MSLAKIFQFFLLRAAANKQEHHIIAIAQELNGFQNRFEFIDSAEIARKENHKFVSKIMLGDKWVVRFRQRLNIVAICPVVNNIYPRSSRVSHLLRYAFAHRLTQYNDAI